MKQKPMIDPANDDFGMIVNWAVRYCLPRETYAPGATIDFLKPLLPWLSDHTLWVINQDICGAESLGDPRIDRPAWLHFLEDVQCELRKRGVRYEQMRDVWVGP